MAITSNKSEFIKDLMKALDINPSGTRAFSLFVAVDKAVTVEIERYVDEPAYETTEIKRYKLV